MDLSHRFTLAGLQEKLIAWVLLACALVSIATTVGIVVVLLNYSVLPIPGLAERRGGELDTAFFQEVPLSDFLTDTVWAPQFAEKRYGILPLVNGTLLVAVIAALVGLPVGLAGAVYLSEYAHPKLRAVLKPILEILAGIPTVVYGYFGLVFVTPYLLEPLFGSVFGVRVDPYNALSAGIVVGIMIIPMVSSLSEDALRSVPQGLREAGYSLGGTKYDVSTKVVIPAALSGIIASFLLAISRAIGETMAVAMAAGLNPQLTLNPLRGIETMTAYIVNVSMGDTPVGTVVHKSIYAVALTLFCVTLVMNILSQYVMRRFREVYQ